MNELSYAAAFMIGLLGSTHCIGMCLLRTRSNLTKNHLIWIARVLVSVFLQKNIDLRFSPVFDNDKNDIFKRLTYLRNFNKVCCHS